MIRVRNIALAMLCLVIFLNGLFLLFTTESVWPNVLLLFVPTFAVLLVDVYKKFYINSIAAGAIGFSMCGVAIYGMMTSGPNQQLGIVSELTTYLLALLVFQRKSPRLYWQLGILSVLQIVVASVFSGTLQRGFAYLFYYTVILLFLSIVSIYRDQLLADGALDPWHNLKSEHSLWFSFRKKKNIQPFVRVRQFDKQVRKVSIAGTVFGILILTAFSVTSGMGLFGAMPNRNRFIESEYIRLNAQVGVSSRIPNLETNLDPTEDSTEVLRLKFVHPRTKKIVRLTGDVYIPRVCLEVLGENSTSWDPFELGSGRIQLLGRHPVADGKNVLEQHIQMLPDEEPAVFGVRPWSAGRSSSELFIDQGTGSISRSRTSSFVKKSMFRYQLETFGVYNNEIAPCYPFRNFQTGNFSVRLSNDIKKDNIDRLDWLRDVNLDRYPTLVKEAKKIAAKYGNKSTDRIKLVRAMESFLGDNPDFTYTTNLSTIPRDRSLDPVEDFVKNFKRGHCQLYASALAIMLRSVKVPCRVVVGYRTNKYSETGAYYSVERRHAHSWVEVYLPGQVCPRDYIEKGFATEKSGGWLRADATPGFLEAGFDDESEEDLLSLAQSLLDDYSEAFESDEGDTRSFWQRIKNYGRFLDISNWAVAATKTGQRIGLQGQVGLGLCVVLALFWWRTIAKREDEHRKKMVTGKKTASPIRRFFGSIGLVSSYETHTHWANHLIQKFDQAMTKAGFQPRKSHQTISEYLRSVQPKNDLGPANQALFSHLNQLSLLIYQLRYGGAKKGDLAVREAKHMLKETSELVEEVKKEKKQNRQVAIS